MGPPLACLLTAEFAKGNSLDRLGIRATFSFGIGVFVEEEFFCQLSQFFFLLVGQWFIAQGGTFPQIVSTRRSGSDSRCNRQLLALRALLVFNIRLRIFFR